MTPRIKVLIGLVAALAVGAVAHGPLGRGEAFVDQVEANARATVATAGVAGVSVQIARAPLSRTASLTGPANRFQRDGMGSLPGLTGMVGAVPGVGRVEWTNPPPEGQ